METLLFWVGGLEALAFVTLCASVLVLWRAASRIEPNAALQRQVHEIAADLEQLTDHLTRRETRERVRKMRDGREAANAAPEVPPAGTPEHKQYLRSLARQTVGR